MLLQNHSESNSNHSSSSPRITLMNQHGSSQEIILQEKSFTFEHKETDKGTGNPKEHCLKSEERAIFDSVEGTIENVQVFKEILDKATENDSKNEEPDEETVQNKMKSGEDDLETKETIYCVQGKINDKKVVTTKIKSGNSRSQKLSIDNDKGTKTKTRVNKNQNTTKRIIKRICNDSIKVRGTLFIIGDSHVRQLKDFVQESINEKVNIVTHFQGGASLMQICNYLKQSVSIEDHVFVFGGTNDIDRNSFSTLKPALLKLLTQYPNVKFTFILVPMRVHWNREYYQNSSIFKFNENLVYFLKELNRSSIDILDTNQILHARHYSRDGIHLNTDGKKAVSSAIATVFLK